MSCYICGRDNGELMIVYLFNKLYYVHFDCYHAYLENWVEVLPV